MSAEFTATMPVSAVVTPTRGSATERHRHGVGQESAGREPIAGAGPRADAVHPTQPLMASTAIPIPRSVKRIMCFDAPGRAKVLPADRARAATYVARRAIEP